MRRLKTIQVFVIVSICLPGLGCNTSYKDVLQFLKPASEKEMISRVPEQWLPITYLQSGFFTGHEWGAQYRDYDDKLNRARELSRAFDAIEVLNQDLDTPDGFHDIRNTAQAFKTISEDLDQPFLGFWSFPRLPGFFRAEDISEQPKSWRSMSLKADGSLWQRFPSHPDDIESLIKYTGEALDITNDEAVKQLLENIRDAFQWDGPVDSSTGALFGFVVLNEAMLSGNYESVWSADERRHDVDAPDAVIRLNQQTHFQLFTDNDPYYSYYGPPKRAIPLFSESASIAFQKYALEQGHSFELLPADRNEFLDDDDAVTLPSWVTFVSLDNTEYWSIWRSWVFSTWTGFIEAIHQEIGLAQSGNPDYYGAVYFQLPGWYSMHKMGNTPITYPYYDSNMGLVTENVIPKDMAEYTRLNAVTSGIDMVTLMKSPWFAGAVHETTCSIPVNRLPESTIEEHDNYVMQHERFRHYFMMQGALLRQACQENDKLFGAFARSQNFADQAPLSPEAFKQNFQQTVEVLKPDIIATIGPWFLNLDSVALENQEKMRGIAQSGLAEVWQELRQNYRDAYSSPHIVHDLHE